PPGLQVTCSSIIKLSHISTGFNLHSHKISWGSGSQQQSVTAHDSMNDQGGLWLVKEADGALPCEAGMAIPCKSLVRLEHMATSKNLHTHRFPSPLTKKLEVSCFGEGGEGDSGDNWEVICTSPSGTHWRRGEHVKLRSVATGAYLQSSKSARFDQRNCPNCPIIGQQEVVGGSEQASGNESLWKADQGLFIET
ncbi:unnamed protein product, partial [Chrysoparadoxa australica]